MIQAFIIHAAIEAMVLNTAQTLNVLEYGMVLSISKQVSSTAQMHFRVSMGIDSAITVEMVYTDRLIVRQEKVPYANLTEVVVVDFVMDCFDRAREFKS